MQFRERTGGWLIVLCLWALASGADGDRLVMIDGRSAEAVVERIDGAGRLFVRGGAEAVPLMDLRRVEREGEASASPLTARRLYLTDGSVVVASKLTLGEGEAKFDFAYGEGLTLPLASVRGVLLKPMSADPEGRLTPEPVFTEALAERGEIEDALFALKDGRIVAVRGTLQSLDDEQARFTWNDKARTIGQEKVYGLTLATKRAAPDRAGWAMARLADGSRLWGRVKGLADGTLTLERDGGVAVSLPWASVTRLDVRSDRVLFLTDAEPTSTKVEAIATYPWPPRRDEAVLGGPITLGGRTFERGWGVHATTRLTFDVPRRYDAFVATIGLDDAASDPGDCVFRVLIDDEVRFEKRVKHGDEAEEVRVPIDGGSRLTLAVEAGENLDIADHADWADARLIRDAK